MPKSHIPTHVRVVRMHGLEPISVRQVPLLRACALCVHASGRSSESDDVLLCRCPSFVRQGASSVSCHVARSAAGQCGPDAQHLDMASWHQDTATPVRASV